MELAQGESASTSTSPPREVVPRSSGSDDRVSLLKKKRLHPRVGCADGSRGHSVHATFRDGVWTIGTRGRGGRGDG